MTEEEMKKEIKSLEWAAEYQRQDAYDSKQKVIEQEKTIRQMQEENEILQKKFTQLEALYNHKNNSQV